MGQALPLEDMTINAEARLVEARERVWLGEVAALESSLDHDVREPWFTLLGGVGKNHVEAIWAVGSEG